MTAFRTRIKALKWIPYLVGFPLLISGIFLILSIVLFVVYPIMCLLGKVSLDEDGYPLRV